METVVRRRRLLSGCVAAWLCVVAIVASAPASAASPPTSFAVVASDTGSQSYVLVNAFHPGQSYVPGHRLTLIVNHADRSYQASSSGFAQVSLPGLTVGDVIQVSDAVTGQAFSLRWQARPSATLGVCGGSNSVAGLVSSPQVADQTNVISGPMLSGVTDQRSDGTSQSAAITQTTYGSVYTYRATFPSGLAAGDLVDGWDQWEGMVADANGTTDDVRMTSTHETPVTRTCSATGGGVSAIGGGAGGGTQTPGFTVSLSARDLAHGLADLFGKGITVTVDVACPPGDACGIAANLDPPSDAPAQAAARRHRRRPHRRKQQQQPRYSTLARGYLTVSSGPASVTLRATRTGRRRLRHKKQATLVLVVTVRSKSSGAASTVKQTITIHR